MVVCKKCHCSMTKEKYARHVKDCIPSDKQIKQYERTRSSSSKMKER